MPQLRFIVCLFTIFILIFTITISAQAQDLNDLVQEAINKYNQADLTSALEAWEKVLNRAQELDNQKVVSGALGYLGNIYIEIGEYPEALAHFKRALEIDRSISYTEGIGLTLCNLGLVYHHMGDFENALSYYEQSLKIDTEMGQKRGVGICLTNIGNLYSDLGNYQKAILFLKQALEIDRAIGDRGAEGADLINLGFLYGELNDYREVLLNSKDALKIFEEIGDTRGIGTVLTCLGATYRELGDYANALSYHEQAIGIWKEIGDKKGECAELTNIAVVYKQLGDYVNALSYHKQALSVRQKIGAKRGELTSLNSIGLVYKDLGDYHKALSYFERSLKIAKSTGVKQDKYCINIGDIYFALGAFDKASYWYECGGGGLIREGLLALASGNHARAKELFTHSLKVEQNSHDYEFLFADLVGLGLACEGLQEYSQAKENFQEAVEIIEEQRGDLTEIQRGHFYGAKMLGFPRIKAYQGLARVLMKLGEDEEGFLISESVKARLLSEAVSKKRDVIYPEIPNNLLNKENKLITDIVGCNKMMEHLYQKNQMDLYKKTKMEKDKKKKELDSFISMLRGKYPEYAAIKYPIPMRAEQVILNEDEVLISFMVTDTGTIWYLVRDRKVVKSDWINIDKKDLYEIVRQYRSDFTNVTSWKDLSSPNDRQAKVLCEHLLSPALAYVKPDEKIILIPDGNLCLLPFGTFVKSFAPLKYLSEEYDITYAHSATSLTLTRTLRKTDKTKRLMFVLADPIFSDKDERRTQTKKTNCTELQLSVMRAVLMYANDDRLEYTGKLAEILKNMFGPETKILCGVEASKAELLKQNLNEYKYVVFATHGVLDKDISGLKQPALALTRNNLNRAKMNDGYFTMTDAMGIRLNCDLAALIACQTGLGEEVSGEGVLHMGRSFQYAGAKSVLVSLWSVEVESTSYMVEKLFSYLKEGETAQKALKFAQRDVRKYEDGKYDHPFFWGAFVLIGG
jgi:tetratricopeptide (TPR) repeat protein